MVYQQATIENGNLVIKTSKIIDQSTLTSDCWSVQFSGLDACKKCPEKGKRSCGGGQTLKRLKKIALFTI